MTSDVNITYHNESQKKRRLCGLVEHGSIFPKKNVCEEVPDKIEKSAQTVCLIGFQEKIGFCSQQKSSLFYQKKTFCLEKSFRTFSKGIPLVFTFKNWNVNAVQTKHSYFWAVFGL